MSELRFNLVTRDWVIIAPERSNRQKDFIHKEDNGHLIPPYKKSCPFCPGNEYMTPPETYRVGSTETWQVRSIPNKFSALEREGPLGRRISGIKRTMAGVGLHDVIIETPAHNTPPALLIPEAFHDLILTYKHMYQMFYQDLRIKMVILFKNHGIWAGTTLEHPHSQIVGTPVIPPQIGYRIEESKRYVEETGECLSCKVLTDELKGRERIILETDCYVVLALIKTDLIPDRGTKIKRQAL
jgi:UDPglucose--hexose-1-phosphate uridylyltransferase